MWILGGLGLITLLAITAVVVWVYVVQNVEQPPYTAVLTEDVFEVRDYPALTVAEVTRRGRRGEAVSAGFGPLARYIFAKDRGGDGIAMTAPVTQTPEKIAMTAPVTQTPAKSEGDTASDPDTWVVRFIMPSEYSLSDLPKPGDGSDVRLIDVPAQRMATIRFSGHAVDDNIAEHETRLRSWMDSRDLAPIGPATYAYYNDPWTPGPLRRNEVMIPIAQN